MKHRYNVLPLLLAIAIITVNSPVIAGNKDRSGEAGATQLLINPWSRSSGWAGANTASARGLEAVFLNVAGTAFTPRTEVLVSRTSWLVGTDIHINAFGLTQKVGTTGVLGINFMSMDFGDIQITTTDLPEGGVGTYSPQFINMGLSYAKSFSHSIYGGFNLKVVSEGISNAKAKGVALDAGIQYVAGENDQLKFGIAIKNWGPKMKYSGDGLSWQGTIPATGANLTLEQRSLSFEIPTLVNIGLAYDLYMSKDSMAMKMHRVTVAGNFTSNSFSRDLYKVGVEYGYKTFLMLRAGYEAEKGMLDKEIGRTTVLTGPAAGFTVELPFGKGKASTFGIDYSYRATNPFQGVNSIGVRVNL